MIPPPEDAPEARGGARLSPLIASASACPVTFNGQPSGMKTTPPGREGEGGQAAHVVSAVPPELPVQPLAAYVPSGQEEQGRHSFLAISSPAQVEDRRWPSGQVERQGAQRRSDPRTTALLHGAEMYCPAEHVALHAAHSVGFPLPVHACTA